MAHNILVVVSDSATYYFGIKLNYLRKDIGEDKNSCKIGCSRCLTAKICTYCVSGYFLSSNFDCVAYPADVYYLPESMLKEK